MKYCTTFNEVQKYWGKNFRFYLRNIALDTLSIANSLVRDTYLIQPRIHFLYFHHVFEDEKLNFERLVATLSKTHTFISHSEAIHRLTNNTVDKPYITWSSDDGFKNNLDAGEILTKYGASCCFFVNPHSIGLTDYDMIKEFCKVKLEMPPIEFMTWKDCNDLIDEGHEIGSHTLFHDMVSKMSIPNFKKDLKESKDILETHCGEIKHFAFPYGKFECFSKEAFEAVFEMGYESCSTAVRGSHMTFGKTLERDKLFIRRDQIIAAWNFNHILYFMTKSVKSSTYEDNFIPDFY
ncbi:hypothetical protein GCM10011414_10170 [Croceivirga lutea]|uniref:polysaccharide deacetylase family protein n=1 Tax=Croceivirga lutea TaxID=1775167 RepID=UPI00163B3C23|nr:polysaccharide deacetylase family protein [Croceivirga lutea]GGG42556.1 hypothetical protein GCM10011414_10170 [Croceivirga lutea]